MNKSAANEMERKLLRNFFDQVCAIPKVDSTIADSKLVRQTQSKLKAALRGSIDRCYCIKRSWGGPCESCQASDAELVMLRELYRVIRFPKRHSITPIDFIERIEECKKRLLLYPR